MHGRVKVRTSAEQAAIKRKERQKQAQQFTAARNRIFQLREEGNTGQEPLELTAKLLEQNPDVSSFFNYRREIFLRQKTDIGVEEYKKKIQEELQFSTLCLKRNPKSYSAWNHRRWCVQEVGGTDILNQELELTTRYLKLDERNFHCWDYRRFVLSQFPQEQRDKIDEKAFAKGKIIENFSNYSAWHYRSKLLMAEHDVQYGLDLPEVVWEQELELVTDPIFIDPVDQSSWIYLQWLITTRPPQPRLRLAFLHGAHLVLVCTQPVKIEDAVRIVDESGADVAMSRASCVGRSGTSWAVTLDHPCTAVTVHPAAPAADSDALSASTPTQNAVKVAQDELWRLAASDGGDADKDAALPQRVQRVVDMLTELLEDLSETDMRGCLQTLAYAHTTHCPDASTTQQRCLQWYSTLQRADPLRRGFYREMCSRLRIMERVGDITGAEAGDVNLSQLDLTSLDGVEFACAARRLNISHNSLTALKRLTALPRIESIDVSHNQLKTLDLSCYAGLQDLQRIDVSHNPLDGGVYDTQVPPPNAGVELCVANTHMSPAHIEALTTAGWRIVQ